MPSSSMRAGFIGTGYIASRHASAVQATPSATLTAVCDVSPTAAKEFGDALSVPHFTSVDDLIASQSCDIVHILTPPHTHAALAVQCLEAGLNVLLEKPMALSVQDADTILAAEAASKGRIALCHNFLGLPSYTKLKGLIDEGSIGRIDAVEVNWRFPLPVLRSGPYGLWMLREPRNLLFEIGPHLFAFAADLAGELTDIQVSLGKPITLPGALGERHQSWRVLAKAGSTDVAINMSLVEGVDDRSVTVRGTGAIAKLDYAQDTLNVRYENAAELVISPLMQQMGKAGQHIANGARNSVKQLLSLNSKNPYDLSFTNTVGQIYRDMTQGTAIDARFSGASARKVIAGLEAVTNMVPPQPKATQAPARAPKPTVLVIGGTGFLGRDLTRGLVADGADVRVLSRGTGSPFGDITDRVELFAASLKDEESLGKAMEGIDTVYHLAKSDNATWEGYLENDVAVTERLARAALQAGVKRFIYTGTIASYDMSDPAQTITEETGFGDDMENRNLYARAKALCEQRLLELHKKQGLPLVIARPGIVVGPGGPLQHWGIGKWNGAGAVKIWGRGNNILPCVLIDDVTDALVKMRHAEAALGEDYNLIGEPMMTGRDYFRAIGDAQQAHIRVTGSSFTTLHLVEKIKYTLKRYALRKKNSQRYRSRTGNRAGTYRLLTTARPSGTSAGPL